MHELGDALLKLNSKRVILLGSFITFVILESIHCFQYQVVLYMYPMTVATAKKIQKSQESLAVK